MNGRLRTFAKGLGLFVLFYTAAWSGWFAVFTNADFARFFEYLVLAWSVGPGGLPVLIQVFALGTAIISTWTLHALNRLDWF